MTHPERSRPVRDRKGPRGTGRTQAAARRLADRMTELNALAALYAEQHGDTPEIQAERQEALLAEIEGHWGDGVGSPAAYAWDAAIRDGLAELRGAV